MEDLIKRATLMFRRTVTGLRDRFLPSYPIRLRVDGGVIPFVKNDAVGKSMWLEGGFEDADRALVQRILKFCPVTFDIGANSGLYTLAASRSGSDHRVFSFEASAREYQKLLLTIRWNRLTGVVSHHLAVTDHDGELELYEHQGGRGALNRVDRPAYPGQAYVKATVPCVSIDSFVAKHGVESMDFMKIDVEGHECFVLNGARGSLARFQPIVMVEAEAKRSSEGSDPARILEFFAKEKGSWFLADQAGSKMRQVAAAELPFTGNWFFVPDTRRDTLTNLISASSSTT